METVEILRGAKDVLRERGWYQGDYYDVPAKASGVELEMCAVCLYGALNVAAGRSPDHISPESGGAADHLASILKARGESRVKVTLWNDLKKRRVEDVFALLDAAIERTEAGELA